MSDMFDVVVLGGGIVGIWTALQAAKRGLRVAVVEVGPASLQEQQPSTPAIRFAARENLGAVRARNHVLTGNSSYWGGGLARNPPASLRDVFGGGADGERWADSITSGYGTVEAAFGIEPPPPNERFGGLPLDRMEIAVLPGRRRGMWSGFADGPAAREGIECFTSAQVKEVRVEAGRIDAVVVQTPNASVTLRAHHFVLSMGVVDSNLFVQKFLSQHLPPDVRDDAGRHLHDHWSVPIARLKWRNGTAASSLFPPRFARGGIVGRRLLGEDGFFHLMANFDSLPPYDRVKKFLSSRQKGQGLVATAREGLASFGRPLLMARAGLQYLAKKELFVADDSEIVLELDFESDASATNRIWIEGDGAALDWDIRDEDVRRFRRTCELYRKPLASFLGEAGITGNWLVTEDQTQWEEHLRASAIDAFHLGGGLQPMIGARAGVTNRSGCVRGAENVCVISTAVFCRPGPANPVLTLLTMANRWLESISPAAS